jgi:hypothetical protein
MDVPPLLNSYEIAWDYCRSLLGESTKMSFLMDSDSGWVPLLSKLRNLLRHLSELNPESGRWCIWINELRPEGGRFSWEYFHGNDEFVSLKYHLEEFVKKKRAIEAGMGHGA